MGFHSLQEVECTGRGLKPEVDVMSLSLFRTTDKFVLATLNVFKNSCFTHTDFSSCYIDQSDSRKSRLRILVSDLEEGESRKYGCKANIIDTRGETTSSNWSILVSRESKCGLNQTLTTQGVCPRLWSLVLLRCWVCFLPFKNVVYSLILFLIFYPSLSFIFHCCMKSNTSNSKRSNLSISHLPFGYSKLSMTCNTKKSKNPLSRFSPHSVTFFLHSRRRGLEPRTQNSLTKIRRHLTDVSDGSGHNSNTFG